ncbi:MAG TPA: hypothetical protein VFP80_01665 [Thermoanaerobaculia bacterium]|nr:hypothetical protein [Thermoanaerobaculia bacterium]
MLGSASKPARTIQGSSSRTDVIFARACSKSSVQYSPIAEVWVRRWCCVFVFPAASETPVVRSKITSSPDSNTRPTFLRRIVWPLVGL